MFNGMLKGRSRASKYIVLIFISLLFSGCKNYNAMPEALLALEGNSQVSVSVTKNSIQFLPVQALEYGVILYPGALVAPASYAPLALAIAEQGIPVAIAKFPLNLAILSPNKADLIRSELSDVNQWLMAGHSLGGVMASEYLAARQDETDLAGLILLASYPSNKGDLSESDYAVLSLYASEDQLTTMSKIFSTNHLLPNGAQFYEIVGGNHAQFAWYGEQDGDGVAIITREQQQLAIQAQVLAFIEDLSSP